MSVTIDEVKKVAQLARLEFEDEELKVFTEKFNEILNFFEKLKEVDTSNVEPTYHAIDKINVLREDTVIKEDILNEVARNAPEFLNQSFVVPKIIN